MLTSRLGDPECKPLTAAQFRLLAQRVQQAEKQIDLRHLTEQDIKVLGYDTENARRIVELLGREEQLDYYLHQADKWECYPIARMHPAYPRLLQKRLGLDAPGSLWAKGDSSLLNCRAVALVGSRELSPANQAFAREVGKQAALQGFVLISGNARGADRVAQESCLAHGGQVISIVADSLSKCKDTPGVLYLSEDGFDWGFSSLRALSRNRLIHAMAQRVLVAQCSDGKGGTWSGTTQNLRHGWSPVFCFEDGSSGVQALIQMGAVGISPDALTDLDALQPISDSFFSSRP